MSAVFSSIARRTSHWLRRAAAALAVAAAGLHAASLGEHATSSPLVAVVTVAMIFGCLYCARHLWMRGSHRDWGLVALMNVGMIALHVTVMSPGSGGGGHHGHAMHAAAPAPMGHSMSTPMVAALATAALEAVIAVTVLFYQTRFDARDVPA
ncbi:MULTISPECIES: hypothetical protein [Rhodococcus]|uniref:hypothetical protein n=1 Tax=Rhodococcus TaxID=1827 RepID=UPI000EA9E145|nr:MULTISPECIES: hypothetical protein [Rhodococcus]MDI9939761.1 hypothetical protein [Rhodococcus sp. IEGM 1351]MDJ0415740.1 hypothetical protein [Rhodococcus opacus]MDX5967266.1 hypothetical protein [Rhodococcus opacus]NKY71535.1 hypothetical protein [Rhodococcus opacus]QZS58724.1 hypothetical protein FXW36_17705 [Rhodococcus opacus]